jgi:hypothetical protein
LLLHGGLLAAGGIVQGGHHHGQRGRVRSPATDQQRAAVVVGDDCPGRYRYDGGVAPHRQAQPFVVTPVVCWSVILKPFPHDLQHVFVCRFSFTFWFSPFFTFFFVFSVLFAFIFIFIFDQLLVVWTGMCRLINKMGYDRCGPV